VDNWDSSYVRMDADSTVEWTLAAICMYILVMGVDYSVDDMKYNISFEIFPCVETRHGNLHLEIRKMYKLFFEIIHYFNKNESWLNI